jgi:LDH2 family malate/lactate/ureidoglycolate dehydrogenase
VEELVTLALVNSGASQSNAASTAAALVAAEPSVRLQGDRRLANRNAARENGLVLDAAAHAMLTALGATAH